MLTNGIITCTYHCNFPAFDSILVLADTKAEMGNTMFSVCLLQFVSMFSQWRHEENWNTITSGHREHLKLTETERRNKRKGARCVFVGEEVGLKHLSRPKFIQSLILL